MSFISTFFTYIPCIFVISSPFDTLSCPLPFSLIPFLFSISTPVYMCVFVHVCMRTCVPVCICVHTCVGVSYVILLKVIYRSMSTFTLLYIFNLFFSCIPFFFLHFSFSLSLSFFSFFFPFVSNRIPSSYFCPSCIQMIK